jgi:hypothetical protein
MRAYGALLVLCAGGRVNGHAAAVCLRPARPAGNAAGYMQSAPAGALQSLKPGMSGLRGLKRAQSMSSLRMLDEAAVAKSMETITAGKGEPFALAVSRGS